MNPLSMKASSGRSRSCGLSIARPPIRRAPHPAHEGKILERYFYDLYGVFMKRLSQFVLESEPTDLETVNLQAMLQEMIKVKKLGMKA